MSNQYPSKEELSKMSKTDILTVDPDSLVDIANVHIDLEQPLEDRVSSYIQQIKNPYCFKSNGVVVKISFAGNKSLDNCIADAMFGEE